MIIDDSCMLLVDSSGSFFFSTTREKIYEDMNRQIEAARISGAKLNFSSGYTSKISKSLYFSIKKNNSSGKIIWLEKLSDDYIGYVIDTVNKTGWIFKDDTLTINNLLCNKATIEKNGKTIVEAWYTISLPIQEGPLVYNSLPGLIVKIKTDTGWNIELQRIAEGNSKTPHKLVPKKYDLLDKTRFETVKKAFNQALLSDATNGTNDSKIIIKPKE
jgi:GLPGLI family protein